MVADRLVVGSAGNVSIRVGQEMVVSARGVPYAYLEPADHPRVSLEDGSASGPLAPTSEMPLHLGILRSLPEVGAIVHTHSRYAAAFAVARLDLPFVCNESLGAAAERVLVTRPYAPPGSGDLAAAALAAFARQPGSRAVLLANHGVVAIGDTAESAYLVAAQVEWTAEVCWLARGLGGETALTPQEQDMVAGTYGIALARETPPGPG